MKQEAGFGGGCHWCTEAVFQALRGVQEAFSEPLVTRVLPLVAFQSSEPRWRSYFKTNSGNQFCERYIEPKLEKLRDEYTRFVISAESE